MRTTPQAPPPTVPDWSRLIRQKRKELGENQTQFGARFGVSYVAVSDWERGVNDAPARVLWWLVQEITNVG